MGRGTLEVLGGERFTGGRIQDGKRLVGHDGLDVEPCRGNFALWEHEFFLSHNIDC